LRLGKNVLNGLLFLFLIYFLIFFFSFLFFSYPVWASESQLFCFYKFFKDSKEAVIPPTFKQHMEDIVLNNNNIEYQHGDVFTIEMNKMELHYAVCCENVTSLPNHIPSVPFSLVIMDVPYGLKTEGWDEEVCFSLSLHFSLFSNTFSFPS